VPIINSSLDLGPPVGVATMLFLGMTHILYTIRSEDVPFWPDSFFKSFNMLLLGVLPDKPYSVSQGELYFSYFAVLVFCVFVLNMNIGIISDGYLEQQAVIGLTLKKKKAACCETFLVRARILPFCPFVFTWRWMTAMALAVSLCLTVWSVFSGVTLPGTAGIFVLCQAIMFLKVFQQPEFEVFHEGHASENKRYLWLVVPRALEEEEEEEGPNVVHPKDFNSALSEALREELQNWKVLGTTPPSSVVDLSPERRPSLSRFGRTTTKGFYKGDFGL